MKQIFKIVFTSLLFLFCTNSKGQTIYGVTGIIKTPNAYIVDTGKSIIGIAYFKDYHNKLDELFEQWTVNFNIGFHSRFELGARLAIFPGISGDSPIYDVSFDRIFSGKFILFKEKDLFAQISIGMQDIVGTRFHNSTYFVASKNIQIKKSFNILLNLGYGSKLNDLIFGDAGNHHFLGFFGGTEIGFKKRIYVMAEYDAKDINSGLKIVIKDWLNFNFSLLKMEIPSAGLALKFTI
jgi:hypothetical protein